MSQLHTNPTFIFEINLSITNPIADKHTFTTLNCNNFHRGNNEWYLRNKSNKHCRSSGLRMGGKSCRPTAPNSSVTSLRLSPAPCWFWLSCSKEEECLSSDPKDFVWFPVWSWAWFKPAGSSAMICCWPWLCSFWGIEWWNCAQSSNNVIKLAASFEVSGCGEEFLVVGSVADSRRLRFALKQCTLTIKIKHSH